MRALLALLLIACHPNDACDPSHLDTAALLAECKLRVAHECPALKHGECELNQPCPQCKAIEECDAEVRSRCSGR